MGSSLRVVTYCDREHGGQALVLFGLCHMDTARQVLAALLCRSIKGEKWQDGEERRTFRLQAKFRG